LEEKNSNWKPAPSPVQRSAAIRAYHHLVKHWLQIPDAYWTWAKTATRTANKIIKERNIQLVFTTAPPFSSLLVGESLHRNGVKWVADFRDPLAYTRQLSSEVASVHHRQRKIVRQTLAHADAITLASSSMASIYRDMFGGNGVDPVFIPTGIDEGVLQPDPATTKQRQPYLLFAGEVLPEFDAVFWEAFAAAKKHANENTGIKVLVVGTLALNRPRLSPFLDRFGLHGEVEFLDQMPQSEIYKLDTRDQFTLVDECRQDDRLHRNAQARRGDCAGPIRGTNRFDPQPFGYFSGWLCRAASRDPERFSAGQASVAGT